MTISDFLEGFGWEFLGTITGILCVWFAARENVLTWPLGIISATAYLILFYQEKLFSDSLLQILFGAMQLYGWVVWSEKTTEGRAIIPLKIKVVIISTLVVIATWFLWYHLLVKIKPTADLALWDSFTTVVSVVAVYFQARKNIICWWLWIVADLIYLPMYMHKSLYMTTALYGVFLILAVYGLRRWHQSIGPAKQLSA